MQCLRSSISLGAVVAKIHSPGIRRFSNCRNLWDIWKQTKNMLWSNKIELSFKHSLHLCKETLQPYKQSDKHVEWLYGLNAHPLIVHWNPLKSPSFPPPFTTNLIHVSLTSLWLLKAWLLALTHLLTSLCHLFRRDLGTRASEGSRRVVGTRCAAATISWARQKASIPP